MVSIRPFRALRPQPADATKIAAVPYDVVTTDEARRAAAGNPLSFLHISRAEIDLPPDISPYDAAVYERAVANFNRLKGSMIEESAPSLYLYRLRMGDHEQTGLAATFSVHEYDTDVIRKHEKTRKDKEDDRTRHIIDLRAQTGPVFLTYRHDAGIDAIVDAVKTSTDPLYDFVADDGVGHTIWRIGDQASSQIARSFAGLPAVYIADGHHRAASASRANARFNQGDQDAAHGWFLAVAFPDNQTQILPYNRVVSDLAGLTPDEFLDRLRQTFDVRPGQPAPAAKGECSMFLDGRWYTVRLQNQATNRANDPTGALDVSLLQEGVLEPLLKVMDPRTDKRIDFLGGSRGTAALERAVTGGTAAVAFSMFPVTVAELMAISDAGAIMPPKSTWFEPKLRDGLLNHLI